MQWNGRSKQRRRGDSVTIRHTRIVHRGPDQDWPGSARRVDKSSCGDRWAADECSGARRPSGGGRKGGGAGQQSGIDSSAVARRRSVDYRVIMTEQ